MNQFSIPIDAKTFVTERVIVFKGAEYEVSKVKGLYFTERSQSMNFVTTNRSRFLGIKFLSDRDIVIWSQSPLLRKTKFENIRKAFEALSQVTLRQRFNIYRDALHSVGYFDYGKVRIFGDGTIASLKNLGIKVSLHEAFSQTRVGLGKSFGVSWIGYSESNPSVIGIYEKPPGGIFSKNYCVQFECEEDRDVILPLLRSFDRSFST